MLDAQIRLLQEAIEYKNNEKHDLNVKTAIHVITIIAISALAVSTLNHFILPSSLNIFYKSLINSSVVLAPTGLFVKKYFNQIENINREIQKSQNELIQKQKYKNFGLYSFFL